MTLFLAVFGWIVAVVGWWGWGRARSHAPVEAPPPPVVLDSRTKQMMGFDVPGDERVPVTVRDWDALKRAAWRSKSAWDVAMKEALVILARCRHEKDCPGASVETESCFAGCPDREVRLSALVILNAGRPFMAKATRPADAPFFAPSREYYSEVLADFASTQLELDTFKSVIREKQPEMLVELEKRIQEASK